MKIQIFLLMLILACTSGCAQNKAEESVNPFYQTLTQEEKEVIIYKGTERPFTGKYDKFYEIPGAVHRTNDGFRTEITCNTCGAHLGHVFQNEGFTDKNTRHCVNSISLEFIPARVSQVAVWDTAYFAGGCFWGVEYYLEQATGVLSVESGYMGGRKENPTYREVSSHQSGHAEVVQVVYNPSKIEYKELAKIFFEIHDPSQVNRQGPDIGNQYRSEIYYRSIEQKEIAEELVSILELKGFNVVTLINPARTFWKAEAYHQDYYMRNGGTPYCHRRVNRFS
jgi:peptide methionine sulfoxide reductase msrA/msrB